MSLDGGRGYCRLMSEIVSHGAQPQVAPCMVEYMSEINLNDRLLLQAQHASIPLMPTNKPLSTTAPSSLPSSVNATLGASSLSSSLASPNVPPLDSELSTLSSATTSCGESQMQPSIFGSIETSPNATNSALEKAVYQCPFHFLDCRDSFHNRRDWDLHSRRHFLNQAPPSSVCCPFPWCRGWTAERGSQAWTQRMEHVARHHRMGDRLTAACRPDVELLRCLLRGNALDMTRFQELVQGRAGVTTASAACVQNDPARDRRRGMGGPATMNIRNQ